MKETKAVKKAKKSAPKKPRIGLDPKGIDKLEKIMLANGKYFYNQSVFGKLRYDDETGQIPKKQNECETELCAAGFARLLAVGPKKFYAGVKRYMKYAYSKYAYSRFAGECVKDGRRLLGIKDEESGVIFGYSLDWPYDLRDRFDALDDKPMAQVRCYIKMLRTRANSDGTLTEKGEKRY